MQDRWSALLRARDKERGHIPTNNNAAFPGTNKPQQRPFSFVSCVVEPDLAVVDGSLYLSKDR